MSIPVSLTLLFSSPTLSLFVSRPLSLCLFLAPALFRHDIEVCSEARAQAKTYVHLGIRAEGLDSCAAPESCCIETVFA